MEQLKQMSKIILIETSTALCSTALAVDGKVVSSRESEAPRAHAAMTAPFVKQMLDEQGLLVTDCDAVCVSAGPGSYTGLRVGSSTAKGLCFGAGLPLIAIGTLDVLAQQAIEDGLVPEGCAAIVPMIDARRMEVYTATFSPVGERLTEVEAKVIEQGDFSDLLARGPVVFIGDGAAKCAPVLDAPGARFVQVNPHAGAMAVPAAKAFAEGKFADTAYFEPFYLKDFVATVSRKNVF